MKKIVYISPIAMPARPASIEEFGQDVILADWLAMHDWTGFSRDGEDLRVIWLIARVTGKFMGAYEITEA